MACQTPSSTPCFRKPEEIMPSDRFYQNLESDVAAFNQNWEFLQENAQAAGTVGACLTIGAHKQLREDCVLFDKAVNTSGQTSTIKPSLDVVRCSLCHDVKCFSNDKQVQYCSALRCDDKILQKVCPHMTSGFEHLTSINNMNKCLVSCQATLEHKQNNRSVLRKNILHCSDKNSGKTSVTLLSLSLGKTLLVLVLIAGISSLVHTKSVSIRVSPPCLLHFTSTTLIYERDPENCSIFYVCYSQKYWKMTCNMPNTVFSKKYNTCVWKDSSLDDCPKDSIEKKNPYVGKVDRHNPIVHKITTTLAMVYQEKNDRKNDLQKIRGNYKPLNTWTSPVKDSVTTLEKRDNVYDTMNTDRSYIKYSTLHMNPRRRENTTHFNRHSHLFRNGPFISKVSNKDYLSQRVLRKVLQNPISKVSHRQLFDENVRKVDARIVRGFHTLTSLQSTKQTNSENPKVSSGSNNTGQFTNDIGDLFHGKRTDLLYSKREDLLHARREVLLHNKSDNFLLGRSENVFHKGRESNVNKEERSGFKWQTYRLNTTKVFYPFDVNLAPLIRLDRSFRNRKSNTKNTFNKKDFMDIEDMDISRETKMLHTMKDRDTKSEAGFSGMESGIVKTPKILQEQISSRIRDTNMDTTKVFHPRSINDIKYPLQLKNEQIIKDAQISGTFTAPVTLAALEFGSFIDSASLGKSWLSVAQKNPEEMKNIHSSKENLDHEERSSINKHPGISSYINRKAKRTQFSSWRVPIVEQNVEQKITSSRGHFYRDDINDNSFGDKMYNDFEHQTSPQAYDPERALDNDILRQISNKDYYSNPNRQLTANNIHSKKYGNQNGQISGSKSFKYQSNGSSSFNERESRSSKYSQQSSKSSNNYHLGSVSYSYGQQNSISNNYNPKEVKSTFRNSYVDPNTLRPHSILRSKQPFTTRLKTSYSYRKPIKQTIRESPNQNKATDNPFLMRSFLRRLNETVLRRNNMSTTWTSDFESNNRKQISNSENLRGRTRTTFRLSPRLKHHLTRSVQNSRHDPNPLKYPDADDHNVHKYQFRFHDRKYGQSDNKVTNELNLDRRRQRSNKDNQAVRLVLSNQRGNKGNHDFNLVEGRHRDTKNTNYLKLFHRYSENELEQRENIRKPLQQQLPKDDHSQQQDYHRPWSEREEDTSANRILGKSKYHIPSRNPIDDSEYSIDKMFSDGFIQSRERNKQEQFMAKTQLPEDGITFGQKIEQGFPDSRYGQNTKLLNKLNPSQLRILDQTGDVNLGSSRKSLSYIVDPNPNKSKDTRSLKLEIKAERDLDTAETVKSLKNMKHLEYKRRDLEMSRKKKIAERLDLKKFNEKLDEDSDLSNNMLNTNRDLSFKDKPWPVIQTPLPEKTTQVTTTTTTQNTSAVSTSTTTTATTPQVIMTSISPENIKYEFPLDREVIPSYRRELKERCGIMATPLIVGGKKSRAGQWPWQVSLQIVSSTTPWHRCGGVLVHDRWVLTAAHCVEGTFYGDASNWRAVMADYNLDSVSGKEIYRDITRVISHPEYVRSNNFPNDVALLELDSPVDLTAGDVQAACLPESDFPLKPGTKCWISGWGETRDSEGHENIMNEVPVNVMSHEQCKPMWGRVDIDVLDTQVCLGYGDAGACYGDSGGPLMCMDNGRFYVAGVMSWLISNCSADNFPNVFTRLPNYMDWLYKELDYFEWIRHL